MKQKIKTGTLLKVLLLEDSPRDVDICRGMIIDAGYILEMDVTEAKKEFESFLRTRSYDIILSDFKLPGFDAIGALGLRNKICPDIPFICVSGTIGEETAIELLKSGAVDYVLKDRPERLPFAIKRALDDAKEKIAVQKAEELLTASEVRYRRLFEAAQDGIFLLDAETGIITDANPYILESLGYSLQELKGKRLWEIGSFADVKENKEAFEELQKKEFIRYNDLPLKTKDGQSRHVEFVSNVYVVDGKKVIQCNIRDITDRRLAEFAVKENETRFRTLFEESNDAILIMNADGFLDCNRKAESIFGCRREDIIKQYPTAFSPLTQPDGTLSSEKAADKIHSAFSGKPQFFEWKHRQSDGSLFDAEVSLNMFTIGEIPYLQAIVRNISERKLAEESLRLLNSAILQSSESILITDAQLEFPGPKIIFVNPAFTAMTGYTADEVIGKTPRMLQGPRTDKTVLKRLRKNLENGENFQGETFNYRKDGTSYIQDWHITPIQNNYGSITHFVSLQRDITERRQAETILKESEEKFRVITENSADPIFIADMRGKYGYVNNKAAKMLGYSVEELLSLTILDLTPKNKVEEYSQMFQRILRDGKLFTEIELVTKDGKTVPTDFNAVLLPNGNLYASCRDITERKSVEKLLIQERNLLKSLMDNIPDQIYFKDIDSRFIRMSKSVAEKFGISDPQQIVGKKDSDFFSEEHSRPAYEDEQTIIATGFSLVNVEEKEIWPDGKVTWATTTKLPYRNESGKIIGTFGISRDITERKNAEHLIRESEKRFKALFDQAPIAIALLDMDGHPIISNETLSTMVGYSKDELSHMKFTDFTYSEDIDKDEIKFRELLEGKISQYDMEKRYVHKNGNLIWVDLFATILRDEHGVPNEIIGMAKDISERKLSEIALQESNEKFHQLADNITDVFWIRSPDLSEVQYVSSAFEKIWGRSVESLYANPLEWSEFIFPEDRERVLASFATLTDSTPSIDIEYRITRPNGDIRWINSRGFQVRNAADHLIRHIGIVSDITQRKLAEDLLRASEEKFRTLIETMPDGFYRSTAEGRFLDVNPAMVKMLGYNSKEELLQIDIPTELYFQQNDRDIKSVNQDFNLESETYQLRKKDGTGIWVEDRCHYLLDESGKIQYHEGISRDISDRKLADEKLKLSEEKYRGIFENVQDVFFETAMDGSINEISPSIDILSKGLFHRNELIGKSMLDFYAVAEERTEILSRLLQSRKVSDFEVMLKNRDGALIPCSVTAKIIFTDKGKPEKIVGTVHDITNRKRAENKLKESEEKYRGIFENVQDVYFETSIDGTILEVSPSITTVSKGHYTRDDLIGKSMDEFFPEANELKTLLAILQQKGNVSDYEVKLKNRDGSLIAFSVSSKIQFNTKGVPERIIGSLRDISERKDAENQIALLAHTLKSVSECVSITDLNETIIFVNTAFLKTYGYTEDEIIGKNISILRSPNNPPKSTEGIYDATIHGVWNGELLNRTKDGRDFMISLSTSYVQDQHGKTVALVGVANDITERTKLQQQLLQAQKNESIGTLAGGIAHDFNNILGIILGYTSIIERSVLNPKKLSESIAAITQAVKRGAALVRQILTFARKTETSFEPISLSDLVKELVSMLQQTFPKIITFKNKLPDDLPFIFADRTQIHQALLNLCVNARDAMPNGGEITIDAEVRTSKQLWKQFPAVGKDSYICISVTDTGEGMSESTQKRIFDPFFTTKPQGKGTGLGLSVTYGVVQAHHGFIAVESELNHGTTFRLYFPIPSVKTKQIDSQKNELFDRGGTETILVVEDEMLLQNMVCMLLEAKGYTVLKANNGEEAVEVYKKHSKEIAVVLTDLGLPVMTGMEEFKFLKELNPNVQVVFASGFFDPDVKSELLKSGGEYFIQKPYMADDVLKMLREVMDKQIGKHK